jgi:hypothetical protein
MVKGKDQLQKPKLEVRFLGQAEMPPPMQKPLDLVSASSVAVVTTRACWVAPVVRRGLA